MSPTNEEALCAIALAKPAAARAAWLDRECGDDDALRARLESLLAAHDQPDNLVPTQAEAVRRREDASSFDKAAADKPARASTWLRLDITLEVPPSDGGASALTTRRSACHGH